MELELFLQVTPADMYYKTTKEGAGRGGKRLMDLIDHFNKVGAQRSWTMGGPAGLTRRVGSCDPSVARVADFVLGGQGGVRRAQPQAPHRRPQVLLAHGDDLPGAAQLQHMARVPRGVFSLVGACFQY